MEAVALYGETEKASGEKLGDLGAIRRDVGQLDVTVASTALVGLDGGVGAARRSTRTVAPSSSRAS